MQSSFFPSQSPFTHSQPSWIVQSDVTQEKLSHAVQIPSKQVQPSGQFAAIEHGVAGQPAGKQLVPVHSQPKDCSHSSVKQSRTKHGTHSPFKQPQSLVAQFVPFTHEPKHGLKTHILATVSQIHGSTQPSAQEPSQDTHPQTAAL